jgi:U32 family peptidase
MKNKKSIELLAPAGDLQKLKYALAYGADAVYLGLPEFSLRAKTGFDFSDLKSGIEYAHKMQKKVYVTVNVFAHQSHIEKLPAFLKKLKTCQPDAIILSDSGVLMLVKKYLPSTPIHLSTQMNTLNSEAVKFWKKNGVKRIILGREATLSDIKKIHQAVPKMELEMFVHGAMCLSYSGRCYLSAEMSNRSANEGLCTQPCRFEYKLYAEEKMWPGELMPIEEDDKNMYIFNSKDLCLIDYLNDLIKSGVISFKIEGRTKSVYYIATVIRAYRRILDKLSDRKVLGEMKQELNKIDNRGYTTGFLLGSESGLSRQDLTTSKLKSEWRFVGQVVESDKPGLISFKPHNMIKVNDELELLTPDNCCKIKVQEFIDNQGEKLTEVHGGTDRIYYFKISDKMKTQWGLIRKKN